MNFQFDSRRSPVYARHSMVASSQPLASQAGLSILMRGGNAADAAVATAAALNVTEPTSTGIGGDAFMLYFDARTRTVSALNGSGRAPAALTIERVRRDGLANGSEISDQYHAHCVTVPGACAAWCDTVEKFGTLPMHDILAPAIALAEQGYPVAPITAHAWQRGYDRQLKLDDRGRDMTINGRAPRAGELFRNEKLARTFRVVADGGKDAFYRGEIAKRIVAAVQKFGGVMTTDDLAAHTSTWEPAISTTYRGARAWECPPNGQGLIALLALNILEGYDIHSLNEPERLHILIEALRLAFADGRWHIADAATNPAPLDALLSKSYADARRKAIHPNTATLDHKRGSPFAGTDTVYFCVVDGDGNAASFINSNYAGFGTGIMPDNCGFTLQNRGHNFVLDATQPNALAPNKRPYHTIIPGMLTRADGSLLAPFGVMGGFMQPQGHAQVVMNLIDDALDPQAALDRPRICLEPATSDGGIAIEEGISESTQQQLRAMGHKTYQVSGFERSLFGRGQIIVRDENGVLIGGSDPRADGCAMGF